MQGAGKPIADRELILWDSFGLQSLYSGVGRHAWDLLHELEALACNPKIIPSAPHIDSAFRSRVIAPATSWPLSRLKPWSLFVSGRELHASLSSLPAKTIVHGLSNYNLPNVTAPGLLKVLTIHDLIPLMHRSEVSKALSVFLRWQMPKAVEAADAIICVSSWTEQCVQQYFPASRGKTLLIPNGRKKLKITDAYDQETAGPLLTISRHESYKRLALIPEILACLPESVHWLVVTDPKGEQVLKPFKSNRLSVRTYVSDAELQKLQEQAQLYVHPSLWEGFCLPAADSIDLGVAVVHSIGSGIDEVVGIAGRGLQPEAPATLWADTILELLADADRRRRCTVQSHSAPSWADVGARTRDLYAKLRGR